MKADAGSIQLKETFPKIPNNLISDEHQARVRLGRHLTLLFMSELKMLSSSEDKEWAVAAKLAFASFGEDMASFIKIKRKCRSAVLGRAGLKLEPKRLIESSCLCKGLFPEDEVEQVHDLAQRDNVSPVNRWQMPSLASPTASSSSSSNRICRFSGNNRSPRLLGQSGLASANK